MKTFSSMRRDFLRTGGIGVAAAAIPMASFPASAQDGTSSAAAPSQGIFDMRKCCVCLGMAVQVE